MKNTPLLFLACLLACALAQAQSTPNNTAAPGSSLPGLGGLNLGLNGPGYIEVGGSHSSLTGGNADWNDFYARGMLSGGRNSFTGELTREGRFGDSGWFGGLGITRTLSEDWYAQVSAGGSAGGFFLPKFRTDALINRKLLSKRQLVATLGFGFDQSKTVDHDERFQLSAAYYFEHPFVLQGGLMWTHAAPGNILARTQFIAVNEGHDKEHFFSLRYGWGREGYEVVGAPTSLTPAYNVLFDFPEHDITATWRQWIGPNWGVNFNLEQHQEPAYHRFGGTAGVFIDF
jgi:YaiO family outer membrane protein